MYKKILTLLLSIAVVMTFMPMTALAYDLTNEGDRNYSGPFFRAEKPMDFRGNKFPWIQIYVYT